MDISNLRPPDGGAFEQLDRFSKLNVMGLLAQTYHEAQRGNDYRALMYLGTTLVAIKYKKLSFAMQGVLVADRLVGKVTGVQPTEELFRSPNEWE